MVSAEKEKVLKAINDLGRRVTVADVASKTGLPLILVTRELNEVASEAGGSLQVATTGDIAYKFAPGFQNAYLAKGVAKVFQEIWNTAFNVGFFLLRISFGAMLILSLLIIVLVIVAIMLRMGDDQRDDDRGFSDLFDWVILRDLLWWNYDPYYGPNYGYNTSTGRWERGGTGYHPQQFGGKKGNFFFNVFSFLFGDGNPNQNIEDSQWQLVAGLIKQHDGVITSEQLAPYINNDPKNEDGVLPTLVRFNGTPEVSESGNIIYSFPSLQSSAMATAPQVESLPPSLAEKKWPFSTVDFDDLTPVMLLASANLLGSWWLFSVVHMSSTLAPLALVLVIYGTAFVLIPLIRYGVLQILNKGVEERNAKRSEYAARVRNPDEDLLKKLGDASHLVTKNRVIGTTDVVYTTEKDVLEQEFDADSPRLKHET